MLGSPAKQGFVQPIQSIPTLGLPTVYQSMSRPIRMTRAGFKAMVPFVTMATRALSKTYVWPASAWDHQSILATRTILAKVAHAPHLRDACTKI